MNRAWSWIAKACITGIATIAMGLGGWALAGNSDLRAENTGLKTRQDAQASQISEIKAHMDKQDDKLDRILDAVGAKRNP